MSINRTSTIGVGDHLEIAPYQCVGDAFGRFRISQPYTNFDTKFLYDKLPLLWDEEVVGGTSTHDADNACINMSVTASGHSVIRQTKTRFNYKSGKSQLYLFTGVLGTPTANIVRRIGCFDANNGLFFELNGSTLYTVIRKSGVDTKTAQSSWNIEKLDGTEWNNISLDLTKAQIFVIDFQWLGVGDIRFGFFIDGKLHYVHKAHGANTLDAVYMETPNLPIRYEITSTGGSATLKQICSSCMSEGSLDKHISRSESTPTFINANSTTERYAVIGIRLKSTHLDASVYTDNFNVLTATNDSLRYTVSLNPTVSGTFTFNDIPNSYVQVAFGSGGNPSLEVLTDVGTKLQEGYVSNALRMADVGIEELLFLGSTISGVRDTIVLSVTPLAANADVYGSLAWKELV